MLVLAVALELASREDVPLSRSLLVYCARSYLASISLTLPTSGRLLLAWESFEGNDAPVLGSSSAVTTLVVVAVCSLLDHLGRRYGSYSLSSRWWKRTCRRL
jgi:hypothetical protein